ncbi:hypothetical protein [Paenibacillus sp. Soil724D2]|nr:hypothetical protein [Paenibacillus sp. Soil724D2]
MSQPVTFVATSGVKVTIPHDPSPAACERFLRTIMDISAKYPKQK